MLFSLWATVRLPKARLQIFSVTYHPTDKEVVDLPNRIQVSLYLKRTTKINSNVPRLIRMDVPNAVL